MKTFISNWSENYFSIKEKSLKRERIASALLFFAVLFLFILSFYDLLKGFEVNEIELSKHLYFGSTVFKALIYQLIILLGLLINFISLHFDNRQAFRFSELGVFISFFSWLGYLCWTAVNHFETSKVSDVLYSSHLESLNGIVAILLSTGFVIWLLYKIIFLTVITWKTIRK